MIKLDIKGYCQDCDKFGADVIRDVKVTRKNSDLNLYERPELITTVNTTICCKYRDICDRMYACIKNSYKEDK